MLLSTATPESANEPTAAEIQSGIARSQVAKLAPPAQAKGTLVKTTRASAAAVR